MSLCEKPRKHAMNPAKNHSGDSRLKLHADAESDDEILNGKVVAPRERPLSWIALLKTSIEPESDDDGNPNDDNDGPEIDDKLPPNFFRHEGKFAGKDGGASTRILRQNPHAKFP